MILLIPISGLLGAASLLWALHLMATRKLPGGLPMRDSPGEYWVLLVSSVLLALGCGITLRVLLGWDLQEFLNVPDDLGGYSSKFEWFMGEHFKTALGAIIATVAGLGTAILSIHGQMVMKNLARSAEQRERQARQVRPTDDHIKT